jgi:hypothetical protein
LIYAKRNPEEFMDAIDDPQLKLYSTASKALSSGTFVLKNNNKDIYFNIGTNKKKLLTIPFGEEPVQAIVSFLITDDGIEVLKMLETKQK